MSKDKRINKQQNMDKIKEQKKSSVEGANPLSGKQFVHLHVHSDYTIMKGMCRIYNIARLAEEYNMSAVALTDYVDMGGVIEFYKELSKSDGTKPILGCEVCISSKNGSQLFHLILLAKDYTGYQNLCRIISASYADISLPTPHIDKKALAGHSDGLIALSGGVNGEISQQLLSHSFKGATKALNEYIDIFGVDNFYLELSDHGHDREKVANKGLIDLSKELNVKVVATNDVRYLRKQDAAAYDMMRCIRKNTTLAALDKFPYNHQEYYLKTADEMSAIFADIPEAITNTLEIAEKCNVTIPLENKTTYWPVYEVGSGVSLKEDLRKLCLEGVTLQREEIIRQMDYELSVIDDNNFSRYFLMLHDIVRYAKENNIQVGPGRGSTGGSIVCYLLEITDVDPIRFNLQFERFINPECILSVNIDLDFCESRISEIFEYVRNKYGSDRVAQTRRYKTFKSKAIIKCVAQAMGGAYEDGDEIIKMIPLEGLNKCVDIHAAGIIIGDQPLHNIVPLCKSDDGKSITQYRACECEELGLLRLDFLGLRTLTETEKIVKEIREQEKNFDISTIPLDDKKTFELLNRGDTKNVFKLEFKGIQDLCRALGVESIEDIIAMIALYRPVIMQFIPEFIARKKGEVDIEYDDPIMEPILRETYGMIIYQEQVIQIVHEIAGYSYGEAERLRRIMGEKSGDVMKIQHRKFINACQENHIKQKTAEAIFDKLVNFSGYCFSKAHSVAYAMIAYRAAYLKANYYYEFTKTSESH